MLYKRNFEIDCLRGVSIILVLGMHYFDLYGQVNGKIIWNIFAHGSFGVTMFFVISGYLITSTSVIAVDQTNIRIDVARFYIRRATRIAPLLLFVLAIAITILIFMFHRSTAFDYVYYKSDDVFTPWFWISIATFQFNWYKIYAAFQDRFSGLQFDILWSLAVEEQFYLIFPWIILLAKDLRRLRTLLVLTIVACSVIRAAFILTHVGHKLPTESSFTCFDFLAIGAWLAVAPAALDKWRRPASILLAVAIFAPCYLAGATAAAGLPGLGVAIAAALFIAGARGRVGPQTIKLLSPLADLGRLSYGAYLLHPMLLYVLSPLVTRASLTPGPGFLIFVAAVYAVAKLSYLGFEQPVERALRKYFYSGLGRRTASQVSAA